MRLDLDIHDELLHKAAELAEERSVTALVREALNALIERETRRRRVRSGGAEKRFEPIRRRRP
jgi:hypothetical protein